MMRVFRVLVFLAACCACSIAAQAASGTWTNRNGGSWTNSLNWSSGIIADGSGNTANFSTVNLPADATVSINVARTIGSLSFDDQNSTKHNWTLSAGGASQLTLAGVTPTITVSSATTMVNAVLAGTAGLAKAGAGKLVLGQANTYSGTTAVTAGTLNFGTVTFSATSPLSVASSAFAESVGTLNLNVNSSSTTFGVTGSGTLRLVSTTNSATVPDLYFGPNH